MSDIKQLQIAGGAALDIKDAVAREALEYALGGYGNTVELHNRIYRGKILTDEYTYDQIMSMVKAGNFSDIYMGDIIERDTPAISVTSFAAKAKTQYVILGINFLNNYGDTPVNENHLVMMPLDGLGSAYMNPTHVTTGAYKGSYMNQTVMPAVNTALTTAFGSAHLMTTREWLSTTVTTTIASRAGLGWQGGTTAGEWTDCKARLMTEHEFYGDSPFSSSAYDNIGLDLQFPALRIPKIVNRRFYRWLSSVANSTSFCNVYASGNPGSNGAGSVLAVCPRFAIH